MKIFLFLLMCYALGYQPDPDGPHATGKDPGTRNSSRPNADSLNPQVFVRDFGAVPGDGKDDSKAVAAAIRFATAHSVPRVLFDSGVYDFNILKGWTEEDKKQSCYLSFGGVSNLELCGAVDGQGYPATLWLKHNDLKVAQPMLLSFEKGSNIVVRNIAVDMSPYYYSAGKIIAVKGNTTTIEVFDGHPRIDGQKAYIMGLYDLEARKAKVVRLTFDTDLPSWRATGDYRKRQLSLLDKNLASSGKIGDGVFWFQGNYTGALFHFGHIEGLTLENVQILNGHGFPITCNFCQDIVYRKVSIKPISNRIATTCRDGLKIYCAGGSVTMDNIHVEGCLGDDGQNIHGIWLPVWKKKSVRDLLVKTDMPCLTPGKSVVFLDDKFGRKWQTSVEKCISRNNLMQISLSDPIPGWVHEKTPMEPLEWLPDSLCLKNSVYRSTGRYGVLLKASHTLIDKCLFENNVAGLHIGGEWSWGYWLESTNPEHIEIKNCTFRDNHLDMRFAGTRMDMAISIASWTNPKKLGEPSEILSGLIHDVKIHDNIFEKESVCASLQNCSNVWFWNNKLIDCGKDLLTNPNTAKDIFRLAPP